MAFHIIFNTTGITNGAGTGYPSGALCVSPRFLCLASCCPSLVFCVVVNILLFVLFVLLAIVLTVCFRLTASDYPFGIFNFS